MSNSNIPLKYRIYESLKNAILAGEFKPGEKIPSEADLCEKYDVSRTTIIASLQMLQNDSFIFRKQGKGTFISNPKISRDLSSSKTRFFGMMESKKEVTPSTEILQIRTELCDSVIAEKLGVLPNDKAVYLKRLRLIDDVPIAITWSYMLWEYGAKLVQLPLEDNFSITNYIKSEYFQEPTSGTIRLTVETVHGADARLLGVEDGFTCCKTISTSYIGEKKFELAYTLMRADKFEFIINKIDYPIL